jgi:2-keto-4-pentenoate hydratase/2-oxohepta-3-ene-1,7-dioic acid hydratase in catechol pathway
MRLATFLAPGAGTPGAGTVSDGRVAAFADKGVTVLDLLRDPAPGRAAAAQDVGESWALEEVTLLAPVPAPRATFGIGLNYADHIAESKVERPGRIVLFAKFPSSLIAHGEAVIYPSITTELDYEGELAVVVGQRAQNVPVESALDYVGGYTIINDVSARDLQSSEPQWIRGKTLDTFAPLGPVVLDAAAAPPVAEMRLRTLVNGDVRQDASCGQMITGVPELIAYISAGITLEPGDIIATGTPSGVALGMTPPVYLEPGDKVSIEITGIGELVNTVAGPR